MALSLTLKAAYADGVLVNAQPANLYRNAHRALKVSTFNLLTTDSEPFAELPVQQEPLLRTKSVPPVLKRNAFSATTPPLVLSAGKMRSFSEKALQPNALILYQTDKSSHPQERSYQ